MKVNSKRGIITSSCKACGHQFQLDMRHKLTTFIVKNPPEQKIDVHGESLTKKKDKKSARREQEEQKEANGNGSPDGNKRIEEENNDDDWGDDDEWSADVSEEAVNKRMKELSSGIKGLAMDNDLEKTESERVDIFHDYVKGKIDDGTLDKSAKEVLSEAERLEITNKAPIVLCELLFNESMVSQIKKHKRIFLRFTAENQKAQKYLLGGFEKTVEVHKAALLNKVAGILKIFYDEDILEEEVILEWAKKVSKKYVSKELSEQIHKKADPFIKWLKEAEEESSDEEDVELTFDERAKISELKEQKDEDAQPENNASPEKKEEKAEEEDDLDIDDI